MHTWLTSCGVSDDFVGQKTGIENARLKLNGAAMPADHHRITSYLLAELAKHGGFEELRSRLKPRTCGASPKVPGHARISPELVARRWEILKAPPEAREALESGTTATPMECYQHNIENFIGTVKIPVGLAGPLRVNGLFAQGDYYVPLATTEAALVASYSRGAQLITEAGGATAVLLNEGVSRAPAFAFDTLESACLFASWAATQIEEFRHAAETTTRHGRLLDLRLAVEGNHVFLHLDFSTGDAAGQNMATFAADAICRYIETHAPVQPQKHYIEGNFSGDKKASALSFLSVRGKKVTAEVTVAKPLVERRLRTTPEDLIRYWQMAAVGGIMSGTIGVQGHFANGLAALYLACGQDVACVAESAVGVTRFECAGDGSLYASVTLPNIIVGTVGGGTGLPSQNACLRLMGLEGPGHARALAEVCAALCLAGELSICGALCAGDFVRAHMRLARPHI